MPSTAQQRRDQRAAQRAAADAAAKAADPKAKTQVEKIAERAALNPGGVPSAHGEVARPQSGGAKVIVGCKVGVGFIDLQLCRIEEKFEQNMQGGRTVKESTRVGDTVRIRGTAYPRGTAPEGYPPPPEIVGGAALTRGVDKDFFDEYLKQNKQNPLVKNGLIFAHESEDRVRGIAKETEEVKSGLDPINPKKDPRLPKSTRQEIANIEPGTR